GRDADALPLARREPPEAVMGPERFAVLVDDVARPCFEPVAGQERPVVVAREEARLLALRPLRHGEPGGRRFGARRILVLLSQREPDTVEPPWVEAREHVRLVLRLVCAT